MSSAEFYVVRPYESAHWNTMYRKEVIQAEPFMKERTPYLRIKNVVSKRIPREQAAERRQDIWPETMRIVPANSFIQCRGLIRRLEFPEYVELILCLMPKMSRPTGVDASDLEEKKKAARKS